MNIINKILEFLKPVGAFAQGVGGTLESNIKEIEDGKVQTKEELVQWIVKIAVPFAIICVTLLIIYAGYVLMSSQGNPEKIKEGKEIMTNAIIGFVVVAMSIGILILLSNTLGLDIYE